MMIPKPGGSGELRFVLNLKKLNSFVKADGYTLPRVDEALNALHGQKYLSTVDLKNAFWSCPLDEPSRELTAFRTPWGLYHYKRLPQGLKTASAIFCRFLDGCLGSLRWSCVISYVDDLLIFGRDFATHLAAIDAVLSKLGRYGLVLGAKKCHFFTPKVEFLGHVVTAEGIEPNPKKTKAISELSLPSSASELRSQLGGFSYYRKFLKNFAIIERPLRAKLKAAQTGKWMNEFTAEELFAWETLKKGLTSKTVLAHPNWDHPFQLHTDAALGTNADGVQFNRGGIGAVLCQVVDGAEKVIHYASRALTKPEKAYSVWQLEALACIWAVQLFRMYLAGAKFKLFTDSAAARAILQADSSKEGGRLMRWGLGLMEFDFDIIHRKGSANGNADMLSRSPLDDTEPYSEGPTIIERCLCTTTGEETDAETVFSNMTVVERPPRSDTCTRGIYGCNVAHASYFGTEDRQASDIQEFLQLQLKDEACKSIRAAMSSNVTVKALYRIGQDNVLRRVIMHDEKELLVLMVPVSLRAQFLRRQHGLPIAGHRGAKKVIKSLRLKAYWPGFTRDVRKWVSACLACKKRKTPRDLRSGDPAIICDAPWPWHTISLDLVIAEGPDGVIGILTCIDHFTKEVIATPVKGQDATTIGNAIFDNILSKKGRPVRIVSDAGGEFVNAGIKAVYKRWGIQAHDTGGLQSQALPVERFHRWVNSEMTNLRKRFGIDWPNYLQAVVYAYNTSWNETTGFSPSFLSTGRNPTPLEDIDFGRDELLDARTEKAYGLAVTERMRLAYELVLERQSAAAQRNRANRALSMHLRRYEEGDMVLLWEGDQNPTIVNTPVGGRQLGKGPSKWCAKWTGPHRISKVTADASGFRYSFVHCTRRTLVDYHANRLSLFTPWSAALPSTSSDIDERTVWTQGGAAAIDSLIIVPLAPPWPFGVARVTEVDSNGTVRFQWCGNRTNAIRGKFQPGWMRGSSIYYAPSKQRTSDKPYMGDEAMNLNMQDIVLHSFSLTNGGALPKALLTEISENPLVWWEHKKKDGGRQ